MKLRAEGKEGKAGRSALEKGMIASIVLTLVSSMFFVGTTLSWFSDTASAGGTVITAGNMKAAIVIESTSTYTTMTSENGTVVKNAIPMMRIDKDSDLWEPGAVFVSDAIYVENTGDIDLEYRLELLTQSEQLLEAGQTEDIQAASLRDVIEFKIVDMETLERLLGGTAVLSADGSAGGAAAGTDPADAINSFFDKNPDEVDLRTADSENRVDTDIGGNQVLKLDAASGESTASDRPIATYAADDGAAANASTPFYIVGRMKLDAGNRYKGLTLKTPFVLVLRSQQAGSEWTNDTVTICTEEKHEALKAEAVMFRDTEDAYWKYEEDGAHVYYCANCEEALLTVSGSELTAAHSAAAARVKQGDTDGILVQESGSGRVDHYCRVCGKNLITKDSSQGQDVWTEHK